MELEVKAWLYDIILAIEDIEMCLPEGMDLTGFAQDKKTQLAIERSIEKIGEAMRRILEREPGIAITNARRIVQARNKIIHEYDDLNVTIIWFICSHDVPILRSEVQALLE